MSPSLFKHKTFCVITGASKGYGRCLLEKFAAAFPCGSSFLILARSFEKLEEASKSIIEKHSTITVHPVKFDQGNLSECSKLNMEKIFDNIKLDLSQYEQVVIVHNAGTIGDVTKFVTEMTDVKMVEEAMNINITGTVLLNASLLSVLKDVKQKVVINVTSLAALKPFPSWSLYCCGKAARNMFFKTLAVEEKTIQVLNWAPGPCDTDMQTLCRTSADDNIRKAFEDMHKEGKLLSCETSVDKLITVLDQNNFESGDHIDFYDV